MNITKNIEQYKEDCVYLSEPIKNNIINYCNFIRIVYSTPLIVLNGIYISICINYYYTERYYNKFKCLFDIFTHKDIIAKIRTIEEGILKKANIIGKTPQYKIYEQLKNGNIKVHSETIESITNIFMLKIAGIWETDYEYGITYKFINK